MGLLSKFNYEKQFIVNFVIVKHNQNICCEFLIIFGHVFRNLGYRVLVKLVLPFLPKAVLRKVTDDHLFQYKLGTFQENLYLVVVPSLLLFLTMHG